MTTSKTTAKNRLAWVDLLEVVAIFLVIICHNPLYDLDLLTAEASPFNYFIYFLRTIKVISVPLFFFVNGYLLFSKEFNLRRHLRKTLHYFLLTLFWGAITLLVSVHFRVDSLADLIAACGNLNYLWFMGALLMVYLLFPLLKIAYDCDRRYLLYFVLMCAIFTFGNTLLNQFYTLYSALTAAQLQLYYDVNFFSIFNPFHGVRGYVFVYFGLGGLAYAYRERLARLTPRTRYLVGAISIIFGMFGLFLIGILYTKVGGAYWDIVFNGYDTIFGLLLTGGVYLLGSAWSNHRHPRLNRFLETISRSTLGIYFIHMIVIYLSIDTVRSLAFTHNSWAVLIYGVAIFAISLGVVLVLRRLPVLRRLVA